MTKTATHRTNIYEKHARVYQTLRQAHPNMPYVDGIELTNSCNLSCPNCPTPKTAYPKGFASEQTVLLALRYTAPGAFFSFHRLGEPLLHQNFLYYLRLARDMGIRTVVSSNGILLQNEIIAEFIDCNPYSVMISLHTKKSLESFIRLAEYCFINNKLPELFCANVLSHNKSDVIQWANELQVDSRIQALFRDVKSHSWAGNVSSRKTIYDDNHTREMIRRCMYIKKNHVNIRWDGTVVACCLDSENITQLGHLNNLPKIRHCSFGYKLCRTCDADWMHT